MSADRYLKADNSECYVLTGCIMGHNSFYRAQGSGITAQHFFVHEHRLIFELIAARAEVAKTWDFVSLVDSAPKHLRDMMLAYACEAYGNAAIEANCAVIMDAHIARKVKAAGLKIAAIAETGPVALAEAQAELNAITAGQSNQLEDMSSVITKVMDGVNHRLESEQTCFGLQTHIGGLDRMLSGLIPGITILAARPSMGKTAFILQCTSNISVTINADAQKQRKTGVFVGSLEMGSEPLGRRLLAQIGGINAGHLKNPKLLTAEEWPRLTRAATDLKHSDVLIWEKTGVTPAQMAGQMYRAAATGKIGLFVVDHIGLLRLDPRANRSNALGEASMVLKKVSMETKIPLVVLSQLNRASTDEPTLKDLRDSGELEQNADAVIFLHRPSYYTTGGASKCGIVKVIVAKQRDGETGVVNQYWNAPYQRFSDPTADDYAKEEANEQQAEAKPKTQFQASFGSRKK